MTLKHDNAFFTSEFGNPLFNDADAHHIKIERQFSPILSKNMNHGDRARITSLTADFGSSRINRVLRGNTHYPAEPGEHDEHMLTLDSFDKGLAPLNVTGHFYHGVSKPGDWSPDALHVGGEVRLNGLTSTSISPRKAYEFANVNGVKTHILHIVGHEGHSPGVYIQPISHYPQEREFMLRHGVRLKYNGHEDVGDFTRIHHFETLE